MSLHDFDLPLKIRNNDGMACGQGILLYEMEYIDKTFQSSFVVLWQNEMCTFLKITQDFKCQNTQCV